MCVQCETLTEEAIIDVVRPPISQLDDDDEEANEQIQTPPNASEAKRAVEVAPRFLEFNSQSDEKDIETCVYLQKQIDKIHVVVEKMKQKQISDFFSRAVE